MLKVMSVRLLSGGAMIQTQILESNTVFPVQTDLTALLLGLL